MTVELRTKTLEPDERKEMYKWLKTNCMYKVQIAGELNGVRNQPPDYWLNLEEDAWEYASTIKFGGKVDAVLFKMTKWCS